jgi:hypothetical protein
MDTFVVRVYSSRQCTPTDDDRLRGIVEEISTGFQATFSETDELLSILRRPQRVQPEVSPRRAEAHLGQSPRSDL